jgi:2-haloacid dehalogenase
MAELDLRSFEVLTFDCYGTLIDWETGISQGLREVLGARADRIADDGLLEAYARHEAEAESGPYIPYRDVLARSLLGVARGYGLEPTEPQVARFSGSVGDWPAFSDSPAALERLARRFRLGVITNCDDDLFARSQARLGVPFEWVVTAEQVGSYKPAVRNFEVAIERIGLPRERILHVAQSLFHDHVPARRLGLSTVWVDRRRGRPGFGTTPPAEATPDLTVPDLATLAELADA